MKPLLRTFGFVLLLAFGCAGTASAQNRLPVLTVKHPDGEYAVDVRSIRAVGIHRYLVDGVVEVDEVNIDTDGVALVRFYFARRTTVTTPSGVGQGVIDQAQEKVEMLKDRIDSARQMDRVVVKSHPVTTHARTIEFRMSSKDSLTALHAAVKKAWLQQSGTEYEVK